MKKLNQKSTAIMKIEKDINRLKKLNACSEAIEYLRKFKSLDEAWRKCERGDWMLWYAGRLAKSPRSKSRKLLVLTACKCARLALKYIPKEEKRPLKAIQTAEKWARGEAVSLQDVRDAAADADAAYAAAAYDADAAYAADVAYAAYAAYAADVAHAAREKVLKKCAYIVRKNYPNPPKKQPRG